MCSPYYVIRTLYSNALFNLLDSVVHVIGASKKQAPGTSFFLANFLPKTSRKRQYLFEFDISDMLNNDSEITKIQVETQARKLLHDLAESRQSSDQVGYMNNQARMCINALDWLNRSCFQVTSKTYYFPCVRHRRRDPEEGRYFGNQLVPRGIGYSIGFSDQLLTGHFHSFKVRRRLS